MNYHDRPEHSASQVRKAAEGPGAHHHDARTGATQHGGRAGRGQRCGHGERDQVSA
jgi:hypothetical protein